MGMLLPDKMFYKIGDVAKLAEVKPSVLRFWETEFLFLKPEKSTTGQRLYSKKEVDLVLLVRRLLYDDKFTIEGVKKRISSRGRILDPEIIEPQKTAGSHDELLKEIKSELLLLRSQL